MKNSGLFSMSEEVTWGYPLSLLMHYGLNSSVLVFHMLLLIRQSVARGRKQSEETAKIQSPPQDPAHCPAGPSLSLTAQETSLGIKLVQTLWQSWARTSLAVKPLFSLSVREPWQQLCLQSPTPAVLTCASQPKNASLFPLQHSNIPEGCMERVAAPTATWFWYWEWTRVCSPSFPRAEKDHPWPQDITSAAGSGRDHDKINMY